MNYKDRCEKQISLAFKNDDLKIVQKFIILKVENRDKDINFNCKYNNGFTPLMLAIRNRSLNVLLYTIEQRKIMKLNLNEQDNITGMTGPMIAARDGSEFILKCLLNTGEIDLNLVDYINGYNLLEWGINSEFEEIPKIINQYC